MCVSASVCRCVCMYVCRCVCICLCLCTAHICTNQKSVTVSSLQIYLSNVNRGECVYLVKQTFVFDHWLTIDQLDILISHLRLPKLAKDKSARHCSLTDSMNPPTVRQSTGHCPHITPSSISFSLNPFEYLS